MRRLSEDSRYSIENPLLALHTSATARENSETSYRDFTRYPEAYLEAGNELKSKESTNIDRSCAQRVITRTKRARSTVCSACSSGEMTRFQRQEPSSAAREVFRTTRDCRLLRSHGARKRFLQMQRSLRVRSERARGKQYVDRADIEPRKGVLCTAD